MHLAMVEEATFHAGEDAALVRNDAAAAFLEPERVSPMVVALTHTSCPGTGQVLCAWGGWYGRFGVTLNKGWAGPDGSVSADDVLAHWDDVIDERSARDAGLDASPPARATPRSRRVGHAAVTATQAGFMRYTGSRVHRAEDERLLRGRGTFVDDVERPRMLHAAFVRSYVARGGSSASTCPRPSRCPGSMRCSSPRTSTWASTSSGTRSCPGGPETPRPPLAEGEVRFVGDPVALVVADDRYIAEDAASSSWSTSTPGYRWSTTWPPSTRTSSSTSRTAPTSSTTTALPPRCWTRSSLTAVHVVEESVYQQAYAAVPIETRGLVVEYEPGVGEITMWVATQAPRAPAFCRPLGMPEHRVRAIAATPVVGSARRSSCCARRWRSCWPPPRCLRR